MSHWAIYTSVFLAGAIKLLMATPVAAYTLSNEIGYLTIALISSLGATVSGTVFFTLGKQLSKIIKPKALIAKKISRYRRIINIKNKFQSIGVSFLMGILSVPIASLLVGKYFRHDKKAILNIAIAGTTWSFALTYSTALFKYFIQPLLN